MTRRFHLTDKEPFMRTTLTGSLVRLGAVLVLAFACGENDGDVDGAAIDAGAEGGVACGPASACVPGEERRSSDGCEAGDRLERCDDGCVFRVAGPCEAEPCDTPGESVTERCGRCGTRTRFCTAERIWENAACMNELACMPGTSRSGECGNCGTQLQICNTECEWEAAESCERQGECSPGSTTISADACEPGSTRVDTCNESCMFEAGVCGSRPRRGEACPEGMCEPPLVCATNTGTPICRAPCASYEECGGLACLDGICSDACRLFSNVGCPEGTKCTLIQNGIPHLGIPDVRLCWAVGTGELGDVCNAHADCGPNLVCRSDGSGVRSCIAICNDENPCVSGTCETGSGDNGFCFN